MSDSEANRKDEKPESGSVGSGDPEAPTAAPGAIVLPSKGEMCTCSRHIGIHEFEFDPADPCVNARTLPAPISLPPVDVQPRRNWTRAEAEYALDPRPALELATGNSRSWLEQAAALANSLLAWDAKGRPPEVLELILQLAMETREAVALVKRSPQTSPPAPSAERPAFTPAVHSTLLEMIFLASEGRCMACGWPLEKSADKGCVQGNCSFRPKQGDAEYLRWSQRTNVLQLARKYARGEFKS